MRRCGGNNGFTDFKPIQGLDISTPAMRVALCVISGLTLIGFYVMSRAIVHSKYWRVLQAIRDAEPRVMFSGYNPVAFKLSSWTLSAVMCGVAGALYVPQVGLINPSEMSPAAGIEMAIWTAVGGRGTLVGLTVEENLRMGLASRPAGSQIPAALFELFPVLKQMIHRRGGDLSGGQQQQLAIARALAAGPRLLILDEPTEGIQPSIIKDSGRVLRRLAEQGLGEGSFNPQPMAIVLVEQFYDFAAELADHYLVMERGEVVMRGRGADMAADGVRQRMSI